MRSIRRFRFIVALVALLSSLAAASASAAPPPKECLIGPARVAGQTVDLNNDGCFP